MTPARVRPLRGVPADRRGFAANCAALWAMVFGLAAADAVLLAPAHVEVAADGLACANVLVAALLVPASAVYLFVRFDEKLASMATAAGVIVSATPVLCLLTYVAAALGRGVPLCDGALARFDAALGFDWPAMLRWFDAHPALAELGRWAYSSLPEQTAAAVVILSFSGRAERLQVTVYAFALGAVLCAAGSALLPALGTYVHYGVEPSQHAHVALLTRDLHVPEVLALRAGTFASFSVDAAKGIITFPSFHATLGILFAWAFWPMRALRWPAAALNAALVGATPLHGSHYLADVLAGVLAAAAAIALARGLHGAVGAWASRRGTARPVGEFRPA